MWPLIAMAAAGALLGGIAGKKKADSSKKPTVTTNRIGAPPDALGGYGRIADALNKVRDRQPYQSGQNNPYMQGTMSHILGRAGVQAPEGGYGRNPYMPPGAMQGGQQEQQPFQIPPDILEYIRSQIPRNADGTPNITLPPGSSRPGAGGGGF